MASIQSDAQKFKATQLNLFKNGTFFIVKEGTVDGSKGTWNLPLTFNPLLSTFWLTTTKDVEVSRIDYRTDTIEIKRTANSLNELIYANRGKKVKVSYHLGNNFSSVTGTLENVLKNTGIAKIKTGDGNLFINISSIQEFYVLENSTEQIKADSTSRVAKVTFNKPKDNAAVKLSYMQTGMNWSPNYNIKIIDDNNLQLEMKALIENFTEEIKDVDLTLTVGAANFKYGQQVDPLALYYFSGGNTGFQNYNYNDNNNYNAQMYSNAYTTMPMAEDARTGGGVGYNNYTNYITDGDKSGDLYMYKLGKVSLPMNTKSSFSIFAANVPYEDVYNVNLYDVVNYASNNRINDTEGQTFPVFHSLKITNNTTFPFTTAPVFVQDKNLQPMAQDQIKYTPTGGKVLVQLAKSTDVLVKNTEEEISNVENARKYNNHSYRKVTVTGKITVENLQKKAIKLNVSKNINGDITKTSDAGVVKKSGKYNGVNPTSDADWVVNLEGGQKKDITYTYEVYVYY